MAELSVAELEARFEAVQDRPVDDRARIDAANALAWMIALNDRSRSLGLAKEAKEASARINHRRGWAEAMRTEGYAHLLQGEQAECLHIVAEAEEAFRAVGDGEGLATVLDIKFNVYASLGAFDKALEAAQECLDIARQAGLRRQEAWALHNLGVALFDGGDPEASVAKVEAALATFDELGYEIGRGHLLERLGRIYEDLGQIDHAVKLTEQALESSCKRGFELGIAGASSQYGRLLALVGRREEAEQYLRDALRTFQAMRQSPGAAQVHIELAKLFLSDGDRNKAKQQVDQGLGVLSQRAALSKQLILHELAAQIAEQEGLPDVALQHTKDVLRIDRMLRGNENAQAIRNLKIQMETEHQRQETEIHRLRYVELASMQARLVESEKLAVLGNLAAGLAHEANTPLGVLASNLDLATKAQTRLQDEAKRERAQKALKSAIQSAESAHARLVELVNSLKRFVRLDEAEEQHFELTESVDSAVTLLTVPATVTIERDYGECPASFGRAAELNQALMSLLTYAVNRAQSRVVVRVREAGGRVELRLSYDGPELTESERKGLLELQFEARDDKMRLQVALPAAAAAFHRQGGTLEAVPGPAFLGRLAGDSFQIQG